MNKEQFANAINGIQMKEEMKDRILNKALKVNVPIQKRRIVYHTASMTMCAVLVISIIVIFPSISKNIRKFDSPGLINDNNNSTNPSYTSLQINKLAEEPSFTSAGILLLEEDYIYMTDDELLDYYGVSLPIEEVLPSLKKQKQSTNGYNGIFKNETRGVYFDNNAFSFSNEDGTKKLTVVLAKGHYPFNSINKAYDHKLKQSEVNGVNMIIANYTSDGADMYYAEFMFNGNGYNIYAENMLKDEFANVLDILVKK